MDRQSTSRVAVISGASSGIGLATAKALAARGWRIIAMGRDPGRSAQALAQISQASDGAAVDMIQADLSLMTEVDRAAREIGRLTDRVDLLINNAGGTSAGIEMTAEGNEAVFASNHLAPFLLTARLLPLLRKASETSQSGQARVLNVSSSGHEVSPGFDWNDLQSIGNYVPVMAYCNAKLGNILFTRALATRLAGSGIVSHAIHPGAVASNFYSYGDEGMQEYGRSTPLISVEDGADTIVWLATDSAGGEQNGRYWADRAPIEPSAAAQDDAAADRLWSHSERIIATNLGEPYFRFF